jgi:peptidyl-prolyl cis-trans isomerase SDCCAG10
VILHTTVGDIDIELWCKETPKACRNFVQLCLEGYYEGVIFHRVVPGFIVQGGDPTGTGEGKLGQYHRLSFDLIYSIRWRIHLRRAVCR